VLTPWRPSWATRPRRIAIVATRTWFCLLSLRCWTR